RLGGNTSGSKICADKAIFRKGQHGEEPDARACALSIRLVKVRSEQPVLQEGERRILSYIQRLVGRQSAHVRAGGTTYILSGAIFPEKERQPGVIRTVQEIDKRFCSQEAGRVIVPALIRIGG